MVHPHIRLAHFFCEVSNHIDTSNREVASLLEVVADERVVLRNDDLLLEEQKLTVEPLPESIRDVFYSHPSSHVDHDAKLEVMVHLDVLQEVRTSNHQQPQHDAAKKENITPQERISLPCHKGPYL